MVGTTLPGDEYEDFDEDVIAQLVETIELLNRRMDEVTALCVGITRRMEKIEGNPKYNNVNPLDPASYPKFTADPDVCLN